MAKPRKTSRVPPPSSTKSPRPAARRVLPELEESKHQIGIGERQQALSRSRAYQQRSQVAYATGGDDSSEVERMIAAAVDALPDPEFVQRAEGERRRYVAMSKDERIAAARSARYSVPEEDHARALRKLGRFMPEEEGVDVSMYVESPGDLAATLSASKQRADAAARADYVYRTAEEPMYVPGGEEILGAPESVDLARYRKPLTEEQRAAAEASAGAVPDLSEEVGATINERFVNKFLRTHTESEVDALLDRARRFTNAFRESRGKDALPFDGDFSDEEVAYAILRTGPARKAVAGRFTAAARGKLDPETGEVLHEGVAARYAMQPALSGALKSAYKSAKRAKMDPTARNLAAAAQAWHLLMKLRGAHKRFDATVRHYLAASKSKREGYGYGRLRLDIFLLAKEHGFAVPPEMGKWPSAKLLHERWIESARER